MSSLTLPVQHINEWCHG
ncbi:hypothetical protein CGLO_12536 [Colletotrichum gloeosporioides Cg-14]|uniref:Uncharacterized protein n=1 Tax=Colletotrichum gloeosporioides (strain Cg-14) TaxID=1237896 RepID=T0LJC0_COLGC|nr:hypothetical protein CGLO_12536 [Colletotrichum gloeosporioides Cg-14]